MKISSIRELGKIADKIKKILSPGDVVFLYGEIGVGKTTFARLLINGFENEKKLKKSEVLSPTFNIVFEYEIKEFTIKHFDLYRLKNSNDIKNVGLSENLEQSITLIEWPELIEKKPDDRIELFFSYLEENLDKRNLEIKGHGKWSNYDFEKI